MPFYTNPIRAGTDAITSLGDGHIINVRWFQAYASLPGNQIAYHIYYSTNKDDVYSEGVKYVSIDGSLEANIVDLIPGQIYFFSVRPVEYDPNIFDLSTQLPVAYDNLRIYPHSILRSNISDTDLTIPLLDVEGFPGSGVIKIGVELIMYLAVDAVNNNLILTNINQRGYSNTTPTIHNTDGFDGYVTWSPSILLYTVGESNIFDRIFVCQSRFEYPNFPFTLIDGYHQTTKDLLTTDYAASDAENVDFPSYDYAGYHRTDPVQLLTGVCVGSYIGGEMGCIDGYGNFNIMRGLSLQDQNDQRQEVLLSVTGRPAVLIKRVHTGITCSCYLASSEYPDDRCPFCYGTKYVFGYEQYFNPRSSDGRITVRAGPTDENTKMYEAGLESELPLDLWTLTVPTIKTRDVIVLFDVDDNEEFRYEVMTITRNNTIVGMEGGQKFRVMRIRKFDPAYQIRIFRNTAMFPSKLNTSITMVPGAFPPHSHFITKNEHDPSSWSQTTSVSQSHNHPVLIKNGLPVVMEVLGHDHQIIL